ncbi:MAG: hypothetical protein ACPG4Z_01840 [Chitinophagales bacterium]
MSLLFACIGITTEIVFTSLSKAISTYVVSDSIDWALGGKTYLWMFIIYACIPFIFHFFYDWVKDYSIFMRALIAVLVIYFIEFTTGFALEMITGTCPWKYDEGIHLFGYIRFDYFPFWYIFALLIINVYHMLKRRIY